MTLAKYKSSCLGMETLLNAPLHTSQQRDKVSCCNVVCFFFLTATKWLNCFVQIKFMITIIMFFTGFHVKPDI